MIERIQIIARLSCSIRMNIVGINISDNEYGRFPLVSLYIGFPT